MADRGRHPRSEPGVGGGQARNARWLPGRRGSRVPAGEIEEYFLFPAGRLHRGKARVERVTVQPLGPTAIRKMFVAVERIAGVEHVEGRAFYGLRRQATDLAPEFASDARALNRLPGHLDSATRERVYQEKENQRVRARAAETRRSMRKHLREKERRDPRAA